MKKKTEEEIPHNANELMENILQIVSIRSAEKRKKEKRFFALFLVRL